MIVALLWLFMGLLVFVAYTPDGGKPHDAIFCGVFWPVILGIKILQRFLP